MTNENNIGQRLNAARAMVTPYIQKDVAVRGDGGSYKAVSHDMVTVRCREAFSETGILVLPKIVSHEHDVVELGKQQKSYVFTRLIVEVVFANADDVSDTVSIIAAGYGTDTFDKSCGKAFSYATKYALLKAMMFETGEDEESRIPVSDGPDKSAMPITASQVDDLAELLSKSGGTMERITDHLAKKGRKIERTADLTQADYNYYSSLLKKEIADHATADS